MNRRQLGKLSVSLFVLGFSLFIIFLYQQYSPPLNPWDFGFLEHTPANAPIRVSLYTRDVHSWSPADIFRIQVIQAVTGHQFSWFGYPGVLLLIPLSFLFTRGLPPQWRALIAFIAFAGPLSILPVVFSLRRDLIDLFLILAFFIYITRLHAHQEPGPEYYGINQKTLSYVAVSTLFAGALYVQHYTAWPFLVGVAGTYLVLEPDSNARAVLTTGVLFVLPLALYQAPATLYYNGLESLLRLINPVQLISESTSAYSGRGAPEPYRYIVDAAEMPGPWWIQPVQYAAYVILPSLAALPFLGIIPKLRRPRIVREELHPHGTLFIATLVSLSIIGLLLMVRGFITRVFFFWPLMFTVFGVTLYHVTHSDIGVVDSRRYSQVVVALFIVLAGVQLGAVVNFQVADPTPNAQNVASSEHAEHFKGQGTPLYASLQHANTVILYTNIDYIHTGAVISRPDGTVGLTKHTAYAYDPAEMEKGCSVRSEYGKPLVTWKGLVPTGPKPNGTIGVNTIYDNGQDTWNCASNSS